MAGSKDEHALELARLGLPADRLDALTSYLGLVASWNTRTNLTGASSASARVHVLVADPWRAASHLRSGTLIDVGSGNGSPGLVLALLRRDLDVTLLEPRARRWAFLREAARELGRPDIRVERCRSDEYKGAPAVNVTVRAVGLGLSKLAPLVQPGGDLLVFGGRLAPDATMRLMATYPLATSELQVFRRSDPAAVSRET